MTPSKPTQQAFVSRPRIPRDMTRSTDEERDLCIAFTLLPFLTPSKVRLIRERFDPLSNITRESTGMLSRLINVPEDEARIVKNPLQLPEMRRRVESHRGAVVTILDPHYPSLLREITDPPLALFHRGRLEHLAKPAVAVVGSRAASRYGLAAAERIARELASLGLTVISGLARGIDATAHRSALEAGGSTIAVLGAGLDVDYPRENRRLRRSLEENGLVLSEYSPGTVPRPIHFPIRNRIISGLSAGVVIVEATAKSGSLITARLAAEQGREVFAIPGSIFSAGSVGPNRLIQYGAKLVHDVDDILSEIGVFLPPEMRERKPAPAPEVEEPLRPILECFRYDEAIHIDEAASRLSLSPGALSEKLFDLELKQLIRAVPGGRYVRV